MKVEKLIIGIIFIVGSIVSNYATAQDEGKPTECRRYKAIAASAYEVKDFEKVTRSYIKAQELCDTLKMSIYGPFVYAIKKSMRGATIDSVKAAYLDTLIMVYEKAQELHGTQKKWTPQQAYFYLQQDHPGSMKKADQAYQIGIPYKGKDINKGLLQQYYVNLYNLWVQEKDEKAKAAYKKRLIKEYFTLSDYANRGEMGEAVLNFLSQYIDRVVSNCESVLPEINNFMKELPQEVEAKKVTVNNFMSLLEKQGCTKSDEYAMLVDTIIAIDPSAEAVIAKAKLQIAQGQTNGAVKTFQEALKMADSPEQKSEIEIEIVKAYYNSGSYKSAHNAGIRVSGANAAKGYEYAARSVNKLMNDCGVTTLDRKANNYYAVELAEKSGNASLVESFKKQAPTSSDAFNADKSIGEEITLSCWNKTYPIKTY